MALLIAPTVVTLHVGEDRNDTLVVLAAVLVSKRRSVVVGGESPAGRVPARSS